MNAVRDNIQAIMALSQYFSRTYAASVCLEILLESKIGTSPHAVAIVGVDRKVFECGCCGQNIV